MLTLQSNLNGHRHLIGYVDSSITLRDGGVHEVLLLMPYHRVTLLHLMNERWVGRARAQYSGTSI